MMLQPCPFSAVSQFERVMLAVTSNGDGQYLAIFHGHDAVSKDTIAHKNAFWQAP